MAQPDGKPMKIASSDDDDGITQHFVSFKFKENVTSDQQAEVMKRFLALKDLCVDPVTGELYIMALVGGYANSPEGVDQNMTQGFIVTFPNQGYRNYYVGRPFFNPYDPHHDAFKQFVGPLLAVNDGVFVFDFTNLNGKK